ncbi:NADP-dependent oxidoreductase [Streptomyces phaeochromogenes]|uniref:NADP-dependent oxidoreductase n=1 Tax=Streptomyces phaeochromogenes TaxID=1923 RepID=UPI002DD90507|nr:NADP-dependent oxidoreductase [Streptomyces phaeochromogenes]WRZ34612.1 NADP-dependent oxidoreductase [Streptomyces phaeochromogenes]
MFALTFPEYGPPSVLEVATVPEPHAGQGQVRIKVRTAAVNPFDWKIRAGYLRDMMPTQFPATVGSDAAGVIDEVGEGVEGVSVGDEVFGVGQNATAEYTVLDHFVAKPTALSFEQAAGIPAVAETALRTLNLLNPAAGQTLLIDGAAGGVGSIAAQFAIADGVTVIGTASEANHDYLRSLGVVPTTYGPGLEARVAELAPGGIDAALDTAGKGSLPDLVKITGTPDKVVTIADFSAAEHGVQLTTGMGETQPQLALEKALQLFEQGKLTVAVDSLFPLEEAAKAHERSEGGHVSGKIILTVARD